MGLLNRISRAASAFKYDALEPRGKRRAVPTTSTREDYFVQGSKHRSLQSNAADLSRNMSLAAWMVRRHLDYVSQFNFHARGESEDLNDTVERLMREDSSPARTDIAGRFGREKMFRLAEMRRVVDGDTLLIKGADGRMQGIQADLIKDDNVDKQVDEEWINGVLVTAVGRPLSYAIHQRKGYTDTKYSRRIDSTNVIHYGFFDRYASDQVRGISPMVTALNPLRDVYENFDYALAKAKVAQLFALSIYRNASETPSDDDDADFACDETDEAAEQDQDPYKFDLTKPNILDLAAGDRAEVLESNQPSNEFQNFTTLIIQVALKALDIPFSFYDESHTNFFGSRAAWLHYERSCKDRRDDQIEMRRNYTIWKLRTWVQQGRLVLPPGMTVYDVAFEWVPRGMPWWDPSKESKGNIQAIAGGLDTPQRVCQTTDTDFYKNITEIAKANAWAEKHGVKLTYNLINERTDEEREVNDEQSQA
jgi:capsid protein